MRVIGVVPAAGYGTRLQPLDCSKEVLPVRGRPVMDYLLERMQAVGPSEIRVVTRPDKTDVADNARAHGARVIEATPATLAESVAAGLDQVAEDDVILLGFPDSIWEPVDGFARVLEVLQRGFDVALGLFRPRPEDLPRYEVVVAGEDGVVHGIEFKVPRPSAEWSWGIAAARASALDALRGEMEPGLLFHALAAQGRVGSVRLSSSYVDMGTHEGLRHALETGPG
jgi:NDP-sugar pyrophosphorylase family protein